MFERLKPDRMYLGPSYEHVTLAEIPAGFQENE
jgi:hypothetical protein